MHNELQASIHARGLMHTGHQVHQSYIQFLLYLHDEVKQAEYLSLKAALSCLHQEIPLEACYQDHEECTDVQGQTYNDFLPYYKGHTQD